MKKIVIISHGQEISLWDKLGGLEIIDELVGRHLITADSSDENPDNAVIHQIQLDIRDIDRIEFDGIGYTSVVDFVNESNDKVIRPFNMGLKSGDSDWEPLDESENYILKAYGAHGVYGMYDVAEVHNTETGEIVIAISTGDNSRDKFAIRKNKIMKRKNM